MADPGTTPSAIAGPEVQVRSRPDEQPRRSPDEEDEEEDEEEEDEEDEEEEEEESEGQTFLDEGSNKWYHVHGVTGETRWAD